MQLGYKVKVFSAAEKQHCLMLLAMIVAGLFELRLLSIILIDKLNI